MLTETQIEELQKPLDGKHVKRRAQSGVTLSYLEGWKVIEEANRIFGHDGWHRETVNLSQCGEEVDAKGRHKVGYIAKVKITVTGPEDKLDIIREGWGFGNGLNASKCDAHELAVKEAETDAMKRALMTFGWPFGLALYDKTQEHVENGHTPVMKTLATPMDEHASQMASDFPGDRPMTPSAQATKLGDNLKLCPTITDLQATWNASVKIIRSLHIVDRQYLEKIKEEMKVKLRGAEITA